MLNWYAITPVEDSGAAVFLILNYRVTCLLGGNPPAPHVDDDDDDDA